MNLLFFLNSVVNYNIVFNQNNNYNVVGSSHKLLISNDNKKNSLSNDTEGSSFRNKKLMSPRFWDHLIHKYWQETIFLSKSTTMQDKYINQLKSDGLSINSNKYKKFLFDFSKALMIGRINTAIVESCEFSNKDNSLPDIKYVWRKGFNFSLPKQLLLFSSKIPGALDDKQVNLINQIKSHKLPIFTVTNDLNQIIIAEPSDNLFYNINPLDRLYKWYNTSILLNTDKRPVYEGLFFINSDDAYEYKQYIKDKYFNYGIYTYEDHLKMLPSTLNFYYKLVYTIRPQLYFRLIPDLKEVGELIYKYQYNKNITFHKKQTKGKSYFQGQPIYIIQPIHCKNNLTKTVDLVNYTYPFNEELGVYDINCYQAVFMNYKVALLAWRKFVQNDVHYNLPKEPKILVYNLEDFLATYDYDKSVNQEGILPVFIPNNQSYQLAKQRTNSNTLHKNLYNFFIYFKLFTKRFIWSLTSRQPTDL